MLLVCFSSITGGGEERRSGPVVCVRRHPRVASALSCSSHHPARVRALLPAPRRACEVGRPFAAVRTKLTPAITAEWEIEEAPQTMTKMCGSRLFKASARLASEFG